MVYDSESGVSTRVLTASPAFRSAPWEVHSCGDTFIHLARPIKVCRSSRPLSIANCPASSLRHRDRPSDDPTSRLQRYQNGSTGGVEHRRNVLSRVPDPVLFSPGILSLTSNHALKLAHATLPNQEVRSALQLVFFLSLGKGYRTVLEVHLLESLLDLTLSSPSGGVLVDGPLAAAAGGANGPAPHALLQGRRPPPEDPLRLAPPPHPPLHPQGLSRRDT